MNETTTGAPLTATVGERVGGDPHVAEVREQVQRGAGEQAGSGERRGAPGRARRSAGAARPFPWGALALAAIGWALATGIGSRVRARGRHLAARGRARARDLRALAAGLVRRLPAR